MWKHQPVIIFKLSVLLSCINIATAQVKPLPNVNLTADFGNTVAVYGDHLAVGVQKTEPPTSGAVYMYRRDTSGWRFDQLLIGGKDARSFGHCIAISEKHCLIGAPVADGAGIMTGAVYAYELVNGKWVLQQKIIAPDKEHAKDHALFGVSVSLDGDRCAIAMTGHPNSTPYAAVYLFAFKENNWHHTDTIVSPAPDKLTHFGEPVSLMGDTCVTRVDNEGKPGFGFGRVYVFRQADNQWKQEARIGPPDDEMSTDFGSEISLYHNDLIVCFADKKTMERSARIYHRNGNDWIEQCRLKERDADYPSTFGGSAVMGDGIAAFGPGHGMSWSPIFVYKLIDGKWSLLRKLTQEFAVGKKLRTWAIAMNGETIAASLQSDLEGFVFVFNIDGEGQMLRASDRPESPRIEKNVLPKPRPSDPPPISGITLGNPGNISREYAGKLTLVEARALLLDVSKAREGLENDNPLSSRLKYEFEYLLERIRAFRPHK